MRTTVLLLFIHSQGLAGVYIVLVVCCGNPTTYRVCCEYRTQNRKDDVNGSKTSTHLLDIWNAQVE